MEANSVVLSVEIFSFQVHFSLYIASFQLQNLQLKVYWFSNSCTYILQVLNQHFHSVAFPSVIIDRNRRIRFLNLKFKNYAVIKPRKLL